MWQIEITKCDEITNDDVNFDLNFLQPTVKKEKKMDFAFLRNLFPKCVPDNVVELEIYTLYLHSITIKQLSSMALCDLEAVVKPVTARLLFEYFQLGSKTNDSRQ